MSAKSYIRGHAVKWNGKEWVYCDTKEPITNLRPCKKCEQLPTDKGHDHCIGHIEGAEAACCGHGIDPGYVLYKVKELEKKIAEL